MGQLAIVLNVIRIPQPRGGRTFHLTPCLDTTPHSVIQPAVRGLGRGSWIEEATIHKEEQQIQRLFSRTVLWLEKLYIDQLHNAAVSPNRVYRCNLLG